MKKYIFILKMHSISQLRKMIVSKPLLQDMNQIFPTIRPWVEELPVFAYSNILLGEDYFIK